MEARRLPQREVSTLCHEGLKAYRSAPYPIVNKSTTYRHVMVEEKQHPKRETKRKRNPDPLPIQLPEPDQPLPISSRHERPSGRQSSRIRSVEASPVCHGGCRY